MKSLFFGIVFLFSIQSYSTAMQNVEGVAANDLKWKVLFNFPDCDHSQDRGKRTGAWCLIEDINQSARNNGVEDELESWITDPKTKSIYISFFSFSNKTIAAALCRETSLRPDLKVTIFLDKGEGQLGTLENNLYTLDQRMSDPNNKLYDPNYKTGCPERIRPRETARGSGSFGGPKNYLQHSKIFMALDQSSLPENINDLEQWVKKSSRVRFTSSSANMSSFGTTLHFENWIFFDAKANDYVAQQNVCAMMSFTQATGSNDVQRKQFKEFYKSCKNKINASYRKDLRFYMVPSLANNKNNGPQQGLNQVIGSAQNNVKVAIHRLTTSAVTRPLANKARAGVPVSMIQDDDTLRASVKNGGSAADVGGYDVKTLRQNLRAGISLTFMETNSEDITHMFHNKFIVSDDKTVFQGAGNFTSSALNAYGNDGNYEQFYVIKIPGLAKAYSDAWDYLRSISTKMEDHEIGQNELYCTTNGGRDKVDCNDPTAEDNFPIKLPN